jgi:hypothetical protein
MIFNKKHPPAGFYVYAYLRTSGESYYIGKGKGIRAWIQHRQNNKGVHTPSTHRIIIVSDNLLEIGAFTLERKLIRWYGRKNNKTGILHNRTDGGEGASGSIHSVETKLKRAESNRGKTRSAKTKDQIRHSLLGVKHSAGRRQKNSAAHIGKKQTEETIEKRRTTLKKVKHSKEWNDKVSAALKGRKRSPDQIKKQKETWRRKKLQS